MFGDKDVKNLGDLVATSVVSGHIMAQHLEYNMENHHQESFPGHVLFSIKTMISLVPVPLSQKTQTMISEVEHLKLLQLPTTSKMPSKRTICQNAN